MNTKERHADAEHQWIRVEQLRAGDSVDLESDNALVIMVEKADPHHVLVAYEGVDQIDYPVGARLRIKKRKQIPSD